MKDYTEIRGLRVATVIGTEDRERLAPQEVIVTVRLYHDTHSAGRSDRLEETLDYDAISKRILLLGKESRFFLVERLADEIARLCITEFAVGRVRVGVAKPGAVPSARAVGVSIERTPSDYPASS